MQVFVTINSAGMKINVCVNAKNHAYEKGVCNKGFNWYPSNCDYECDKSCDIGEHLDYSNSKCRKNLVDKLIEERIKSIEETILIETSAENEHKCSSCTLYVVLFWIFFIFFIINVGTDIYFTYYKYLSRNKINFPKYGYTCQTTIH